MQSRCLNTRPSGVTAQVQARRPAVSRSSLTCKAAAQDPLLLRVARGEGVTLVLHVHCCCQHFDINMVAAASPCTLKCNLC
jgi:hypothetical protein